jgi:hypothetical protein
VYKLIILGLAAISTALVAFGCGSSEEEEATAQVNRAEFMKKAKAVCAATQPKFVVEFNRSTGLADFSNRAASLLKQEAEGLERLEGPEDAEAKLEPLIANMSKVSVVVSREGKAGLEDPAIAAYKQEAKELGLGAC